jgi:hypothetical protein
MLFRKETQHVLFDWFRRSPPPAAPDSWQVRVEDDSLVIENQRGDVFAHTTLTGAGSVRVVPLTRGTHHAAASGWQVALRCADGDVLVGQPLSDWQSARDLARLVCHETRLPMDELTEALFSRVGKMKL